MFAALELTALFSFLLIGFDREVPAARRAAMLALVLTAGSSLLFLLGALLLSVDQGTTVIGELRAGGGVSTLAAACLIAGVLAKSAQMPLHFWLPRAMIAPTPVSAYLHSAALVAAGVFVVLRLRPLFGDLPQVLAPLVWIGFTGALVGGLLALCADEFKRILAYSTIAQYGHVLVLIGLGGEYGLVGAPLFIFGHGLCKAALFLTAGAVTSATGADRLSAAVGNWRDMPLLAGASALAAAGLAGLPLTVGYFKEEFFFAAAVHAGTGAMLAAGLAAGLTLAYIGRFWLGLFRPGRPAAGNTENRRMSGSVALLALGVVLAGLITAPQEPVFAAAGEVAATHPLSAHIAYHLSPRPDLWITLAAWTLGLLLLLTRRRYVGALERGLTRLSGYTGPAMLAARAADLSRSLSDRLHALEVRDLRDRIAAVLLPSAGLVVIGVVAKGELGATPGAVTWSDVPLMAALLTVAAAALILARSRHHMDMILLLSFVGFGLAVVFSIAHAPEVALVVVIVETLLTMLFITLFTRVPKPRMDTADRATRGQGALTAVIAGVSATWVAWFALGEEPSQATAHAYPEFAELAHAGDSVSAIIADFRGLDTLGEITVLAVAVLGAVSISRGRGR